jgi:hypothetical protein
MVLVDKVPMVLVDKVLECHLHWLQLKAEANRRRANDTTATPQQFHGSFCNFSTES